MGLLIQSHQSLNGHYRSQGACSTPVNHSFSLFHSFLGGDLGVTFHSSCRREDVVGQADERCLIIGLRLLGHEALSFLGAVIGLVSTATGQAFCVALMGAGLLSPRRGSPAVESLKLGRSIVGSSARTVVVRGPHARSVDPSP